jgi:two-component system CheB/CheR fusion protein
VLFAVHDLLADAPFARLDLVSCRNLLISLDAPALERALAVFHFSLRPGGLLLLGASESIGAREGMFGVVDAKRRLYRRLAAERSILPGLGTLGGFRHFSLPPDDATPASATTDPAPAARPSLDAAERGAALADVHSRLVERYAPPSLVVDAQNNVVHMTRSAGRFLTLPGGAPSRDLLQLVEPALRTELRTALRRAADERATVQVDGIPVKLDGKPASVNLSVSPADDIAPDLRLVLLSERPDGADLAPGAAAGAAARTTAEAHAAALEREVDRLKARLRHTVEQHETSVEELKASNEELQAMNEELRSATEELETSREELQSINEELSTVNAELKTRVEEIARSNGNLHNLMGSIAIPTVFLDAELNVTLYTPSAVPLFHFIASDVGRPLADLAQRIDYPDLPQDARRVLTALVPVEREVGDTLGHWYLARLQPYRTLDERIAGVVMTFTEITERRRAELALLDSRHDLEARVRLFDAMIGALPLNVCTFDPGLRLVYANGNVQQRFGRSEAEIAGKTLVEAGCPAELAESLQRQMRRVLETGRAMRPVDGLADAVESGCAPARGAGGAVEAIVCWWRDAPLPAASP